jgi:hypothetical protein
MSGPRCPHCRKPIPPITALDAQGRPVRPTWAPFCSERCKMADLGRWLGGGYVIPGRPLDDDELPPPDTSET